MISYKEKETSRRIDSALITLQEIEEKQIFFNIPIYQRLYVWESGQVKTLMEDIEAAYSDGKELFYLGGVLVVENETLEDGKVYDLIDGQQRLTTLWMLSIVFGGAMKPFIERVEKDKNRHRVSFSIRDDIYRFFKEYINGNENFRATSRIENAMALIQDYKRQFQREEPGKALKIAEYIFNKVQLIFTEVPKETDLNKLFEVINNRGVQLQHHEILKAQFLNKLISDDRLKYSYLWDACSNMEAYIERNIRDIAKISIQDLFSNEASRQNNEGLSSPEKVLSEIAIHQNDNFEPLSLSEILEDPSNEYEYGEDTKTEEYEADDVRSIITFPMLLQHTLRIFLATKKEKDIPKILDKELLNIFSSSFFYVERTVEEIKGFIQLLWKVRYGFDKYIIKWVPKEDNEEHLICKLEKYKSGNDKYYLRRRHPTSNEGEALLQSMLYHSQQITTHYWLTPYLNFLVNHNGQDGYQYLKKLDNYLFCSEEKDSLIVRTRRFLENERHETGLNTDILTKSLSTAFPHYWFYKLEYILWEKYSPLKNDSRWNEFKISAKNSVEHISPQKPKETDTNKVTGEMLNKFGNLALVSRSINSEYSNLPFNEKRQRFKNNNRIKLDSLKMDLIYSNEVWNDQKAQQHQDEMINIINEYLDIPS